MAITLPVAYTAFCLQHQSAYLRYAHYRLGEWGAARTCVQGALGELVTMWPQMMGSARPSAVAWQVLRAWVAAAGRPDGAGRAALPPLSAVQTDTVVLRHELRLPEPAIASVMGLDEGTVTSHLRYAARARVSTGSLVRAGTHAVAETSLTVASSPSRGLPPPSPVFLR
ncbi:hypothetical protein ACFYMW_36290 [Streptomyces sp. NPDC006692]|uniref:hypothetical protein n=1 Tax=Streptomyces sp. NPDC006692 TaxID=3364758 RepID=UPI0036A3A6A5